MRFVISTCLHASHFMKGFAKSIQRENPVTFCRKMNCKVCHSLSGKNPNLSFFRFPSDYSRCKEWARLCNISHIFEKYGPEKFYKSFRICSDHFDSKYVLFDGRKKKLMNCALPNDCQKSSSDADNSFTLKLLRSLCRFCAEENADLTDIFSWRGKTLKLEEKIKVFPITVNKSDKLPLKICNQCIVKISKFYDFVKNCVRADMRLKTILGVNESVKNNESLECREDEDEKESFGDDGSTLVTKTDPMKDNLYLWVSNNSVERNISLLEQPQYQQVENTMVNAIKPFSDDYINIQPEKISGNQVYSILNKHICNICFKTFKDPEILRSHATAHSLQPDECGRYKCKICNKIFWNKYRLNEHNRIHTGEYPFKCSVCQKKFHRMALLKQHSIIHESRKRFVCSVCNLRSSRKGNLLQHLRTHYNASKRQNQLNSEANVHHTLTLGRKKLNDISRNEGLSEENDLDVMNTEMELVCGLCQTQFPDKKSLRSHFENHIFKCQNCQRDYKPQNGRLTQECGDCMKKDVEPDRIYRCEACGVKFKRKDTLKNHMRIHTGERPFVCKTCGFAFKQKGDCVKHERNHNRKIENG